MKKYLGFVAISVFLFYCADTERDNPYDERAVNYIGNSSWVRPSSSVKTGEPSSSSRIATSSSSVVPSSSSIAPSSSSTAVISSSSVPSSSSLGGGNTCIADFGEMTIGSQVWAKKNLNCNVEGSKCNDNNPANCATYGRLYNWATAMNLPPSCNSSTCSDQVQQKHQGICPSGWHIPSDAEWTALTNYVGGSSTAGTKLKAKSRWNNNGNGTDDYGFSALPGGGGGSDGSFVSVGSYGFWWSATEGYNSGAYDRSIQYNLSNVLGLYGDKSNLCSVRCVKD